MSKSKTDRFKLASVLKNLHTLASSLPSEAERCELQSTFDSLSQFLTVLRDKLAELPSKEETHEAAQAISKIQNWLSRAETSPALSAALGLSRSPKERKPIVPTRPDPERARSLLQSLDGLSVEDVRRRLERDDFSLSDLRTIAVEFGVSSPDKSGREALAQQLAPKIVNDKSYWRLGREEERKA